MPSRTKKALEMLEANPELTPYAVAKDLGISPSTIYHALARRKDKEICPCCGQVIVRYDEEGNPSAGVD
jgi:hypothetical protein